MALKPIGDLGQIPTITVGSANTESQRVFTDVDNLKIIFTRCSTAGQAWSAMYEIEGTAGYVVPASKTFDYKMLATSSGANTDSAFGHGSTQLAGINQGSAPTDPKYIGGLASGGLGFLQTLQGTYAAYPLSGQIAAGRYPFYWNPNGNTSYGRMYGYVNAV